MTVSKHWCNLEIDTDTKKHEDLNLVFANHGEEEEMYPLTTKAIAEAQCKDQELMVYFKENAKTPKEDISFQLIEDTKVLCKNDKLIIPDLYATEQSVGIIITSSTLGTPVSKRQ
jgi:hypothetical protein